MGRRSAAGSPSSSSSSPVVAGASSSSSPSPSSAAAAVVAVRVLGGDDDINDEASAATVPESSSAETAPDVSASTVEAKRLTDGDSGEGFSGNKRVRRQLPHLSQTQTLRTVVIPTSFSRSRQRPAVSEVERRRRDVFAGRSSFLHPSSSIQRQSHPTAAPAGSDQPSTIAVTTSAIGNSSSRKRQISADERRNRLKDALLRSIGATATTSTAAAATTPPSVSPTTPDLVIMSPRSDATSSDATGPRRAASVRSTAAQSERSLTSTTSVKSVALSWLVSTKPQFPEPPALTPEEEADLVKISGKPLPRVRQRISFLDQVLRDLRIKRMKKGAGGADKDDADDDLDDLNGEANTAGLSAEEIVSRMQMHTVKVNRARRRRCITRCVVIALAVFILLCIIVIPVIIKVVIPNAIIYSFEHGSGGGPFIIDEISFYNFSNFSAIGTFSAHEDGPPLIFNIPVSMDPGSTWTFRTFYAQDTAANAGNGTVQDTSGSWHDMASIAPFTGGATVVNGRITASASNFTLNILNDGQPLAAFVGGITRLFRDFDSTVVPMIDVALVADFWVGILHYTGLSMSRRLDVGAVLAQALTSTSSTSSDPSIKPPVISALGFSILSDGSISTGLEINLDPKSGGTPIGLRFKDIAFNLTLDGSILARCRVPALQFAPGDTDLLIPLQFTPVTNHTLTISDSALLLSYEQAKYIGASGVTARDEHGNAVAWLDAVAAAIDLSYPLSGLQGAGSGVVASWVLSVALKSIFGDNTGLIASATQLPVSSTTRSSATGTSSVSMTITGSSKTTTTTSTSSTTTSTTSSIRR